MNKENKKQLKNFMYNVVWLRENYKLSKKKMAQIMGIGVDSLNKIESGMLPNRLSTQVLFNIYDCFKITPADQLSLHLKGEELNNVVNINEIEKYLQKLYLENY